MQDNWVDFKAVKAAVNFPSVLDHYQVNWLKEKGDELTGRCPIHQGAGQSSFHVSLSKNAFHCFSCKAHGNVLDFVAAMEKCSVRDAAIKLTEWFTVSAEPAAAQLKEKTADSGGGVGDTKTAANKPLNFQLKSVDCSHPYLADRGISKETAEAFGVGFFSGKGFMNGRIVIPIHNQHGELVAYAGRAVDGSEPRYKLPAGFHKSLELFNLHRVTGPGVVLVEGFFDCMKVHQAGFPTVALMGSSFSEAQQELLVAKFERVVVMLDGDEPGRLATAECVRRLASRIWVRAAVVPEGKQPDQLSSEELRQILRIDVSVASQCIS
jgi:DNA primase